VFDDEAGLGSDNEDNDKERAIDYEAEGEIDGLDLDQDLKELIENAPEEGVEENALAVFLKDMKDQDKEDFKKALETTMGVYKKRGREELEDEDILPSMLKFKKVREGQ